MNIHPIDFSKWQIVMSKGRALNFISEMQISATEAFEVLKTALKDELL